MPLTPFILYFLRKDADSVTFREVKVTKKKIKKGEFFFFFLLIRKKNFVHNSALIISII